jgi:hypothetical protein
MAGTGLKKQPSVAVTKAAHQPHDCARLGSPTTVDHRKFSTI